MMSSGSTVSPYVFEVKKQYFDMIKNRTKTIEGRKNSPTWRNIMIGDIVRVRSGNEEVLVKVTDIKLYTTLYEYLFGEDINKIMPGLNVSEVYDAYMSFWTREEIEEYGMRSFHIELL